MTLRALSPTVQVSPQLSLEAPPALATSDVLRIISNRPDGEDTGQPTAAQMEAAARAAGLNFVWIPVTGLPGPDQVKAVGDLLADAAPTIMFCRSGMRSAAIWAMAQRLNGADPDDLREAAANAGYDISRIPL